VKILEDEGRGALRTPLLVIGPASEWTLQQIDFRPSSVLSFIDQSLPKEATGAALERVVNELNPRRFASVRIECSEGTKSLEGWKEILDHFARSAVDRDSVVLVLGGGVLGDAVGFASSTWHRGVRWMAIPTTLIAMVDAHFGGKTALNVEGIKNRVGSFWSPHALLIDPAFLNSLPSRELRSGWAERGKSAWIGDAILVEELENQFCHGAVRTSDRGDSVPRPTLEQIDRALQVKRTVVAEDPWERNRRRVLNFGHTLGHALELEEDLNLTHGEAVSIGMVFAARVAEDRQFAPQGTTLRIERLLSCLGLPIEWPTDRVDTLLKRISADKKASAGALSFVVPHEPGRVEIIRLSTDELKGRLSSGSA